MKIWSAVVALGLSLAAVPVTAEYRREGLAQAYFCSGFILKKCQAQEIDLIARNEDGSLFHFGNLFSVVDKFDAHSQVCRVNNSRNYGDPEYTAFLSSSGGGTQNLGVPDYFEFRCSQFNWSGD